MRYAVRLRACRYHEKMDRFMRAADLMMQGSHICEEVVISLTTEKQVNSEYVQGLIKKIEEMRADGYVYTQVRLESAVGVGEILKVQNDVKPTGKRRAGGLRE